MTSTSQSTSPSESLREAPRLLVVEDESVIREALGAMLRHEGYEVTLAADGLEGIERLAQRNYSVVLSDNHMPKMRGLDFLSRARELQPQATRILITGVVDLDTLLKSINSGELYRFIIKPWVREELLATLRNAVQRHDLLLQNDRLLEETRQLNTRLGCLNRDLEQQLGRELEQNRQLEKLNQALAGNLKRSVDLSVQTLQTFYPTLGNRARRVHQLCSAMADTLLLKGSERATLEVAAQLHDIGMLGVPRELIRRWQRSPDQLGDAEKALIRHHPVMGQELARFIDDLEGVGQVIRAHHEAFDGSGYPDGLHSDGIPWLARLLAVAVAYVEASGSDTDVAAHLRKLAGRRLDPEAVRVLLRGMPQGTVVRGQREVLLQELSPGMVLARGVCTSNGMLLIPEGQALNEVYINKLLNHHRVNPLREALLVYC